MGNPPKEPPGDLPREPAPEELPPDGPPPELLPEQDPPPDAPPLEIPPDSLPGENAQGPAPQSDPDFWPEELDPLKHPRHAPAPIEHERGRPKDTARSGS
jgi:hypothetical protein